MAEASVADGTQEGTAAVQVDPFDFFRGVASKVIGLGGNAPGHDPYYVFHTPYVRAARGHATFTMRFAGLVAKRGTLTLRVHMLPDEPGAHAVLVNSERIALNRLIVIGGEVSVRFEAFRGMTYAVYGLILDDTDARAEALTVTLDRPDDGSDTGEVVVDVRSTAYGTDRLKPSPRLLSMEPPTLAHPVSQMCTASQFGEAAHLDWVGRLGEPAQRDRRQWELVYVLQVLRYYGLLEPGARGVGFGPAAGPLPAAMAAAGVSVVATGRELHGLDELRRPAICDGDRFAAKVSLRPVDPAAIPEDLVNFDFGWSIGAFAELGSPAAAGKFVEDMLACLRPGGFAVHVADYGLDADGGDAGLFRRIEMERLALGMISRGHEVAQIKLDGAADAVVDQHGGPDGSVTSFGLIVRKAAAPF